MIATYVLIAVLSNSNGNGANSVTNAGEYATLADCQAASKAIRDSYFGTSGLRMICAYKGK